MRYELSDYEWTATKPMLPNTSRGVRWVNDPRVLNGIFWVLRSGAPWRDLRTGHSGARAAGFGLDLGTKSANTLYSRRGRSPEGVAAARIRRDGPQSTRVRDRR